MADDQALLRTSACLAEHSERSRVLLARRMRWLRRIRERTSAEERWENEGGAMW